MKRIVLLFAVFGTCFGPAFGQAQFPANTVWGNPTSAQSLPRTVPLGSCTSTGLLYTPGAGFSCATPTQITAACNSFSSTGSGCVPASGGGIANFLRADGAWVAPPGGGGGSPPGGSLNQVQINAGGGSFAGLTNTQLTANINTFTAALSGAVPAAVGASTLFLRGDGTWAAASSGASGSNPTASVGLAAVNGSATSYMRSDAAPALSQAIAPTWTGIHTFSNDTFTSKTLTVGNTGGNVGPGVFNVGWSQTPVTANRVLFYVDDAANSVNGHMFNFTLGTLAAPYTPPGTGSLGVVSTTQVAATGGGETYGNWFHHVINGGTGSGLIGLYVQSDCLTGFTPSGTFAGCQAVSTLATSQVGGHVFGINPFARCTTVPCVELVGGEIDTDNQINGTTTKVGLQVVDVSTSTGTVSGDNTGYMLTAVSGAYGYNTGLSFGTNAGSFFPLRSTATVIRATSASTVANGIDFSTLTITGNAWASPGATLDGLGGWHLTKPVIVNSSIASGIGGTSATITQTQANPTDTSDSAFSVVATLSAASATNELINRVFRFSFTNNLTGGGAIQNARMINIAGNTNAGTTTTNMDGLYIEVGSTAGTVTTGAAIHITGWQGATKYGINDGSGGFWYMGGPGSALITAPVLVSQLPACSAGIKGGRSFVTDATSATFHAAPGGSGSFNVGVICDGTAWYIN